MARELLKRLEEQVSVWPGIAVHPHRFGGREFCIGSSEVGHVHNDGAVEIPFPRAFRDELLTAGLAEKHRWVPESGWVTFLVREERDLQHAVWLMRLSYLRYALKAVPDPAKRFHEESEQLQLSPRMKALLQRFVPQREEVGANAQLAKSA
jgi:Family of unknown function (DUF5519)